MYTTRLYIYKWIQICFFCIHIVTPFGNSGFSSRRRLLGPVIICILSSARRGCQLWVSLPYLRITAFDNFSTLHLTFSTRIYCIKFLFWRTVIHTRTTLLPTQEKYIHFKHHQTKIQHRQRKFYKSLLSQLFRINQSVQINL